MIPWRTLDEAEVPGEPQPLVLLQRGDEFVVRRGTVALMGSGMHASEDRLAAAACEAIAARPQPRVLVGGLGMGFTLAAALQALPAQATVVVAELIPAVVAWNRGPLAPLAGHPLADPRVVVEVGDVRDVAAGGERWDAILLDVDNGPDGFTRRENASLYSLEGLRAWHARLTERGVLAVWSVAPDDAFTRRFAGAGFHVREEVVRARPGKGARHTLWFGVRRASGGGSA